MDDAKPHLTYREIAAKWRPEIFLCAVYVCLYGYLLIVTGALPYVMDNNESFSAFWHARNLYDFGWAKSFGLTDEAFAYHAAAHPYIHTHQGNFPRVFAFLIYVLGARTIESQIVVTTFTVGMLSVLFAYRYFRLLANSLLACIAVLLLMTDYVLVMQWHVGTYRVWHMFFVFSTLLCAHGIGGERRRLWLGLTFVNYVCLFYFELIFVAFVALFAGLYTAWLYRKDARTLLLGWACQIGGAVIALSVLAVQLALYLGWDGFLHDTYLTFIARNQSHSPGDFLDELREFYESHHIAFWYNLEDGSRYLKLGHFAASLMYYEFQLHTPYFFTLTSILAGGYVLGHASASAVANGRSATGRRAAFDAGAVIFSLPVMASLGLVAVFLVRWHLRGVIDSPSPAATATLIAVPLALVLSVTWGSAWEKQIARTEKTFPAVNWHSLMPNLLGGLILLAMLPAVLECFSISQLSLDRSAIVVTIMVCAYGLLLVHQGVSFVWTLPYGVKEQSRIRELSGRWLTALFLYVSMGALCLAVVDDNLYRGLPTGFFLSAMAPREWAVLAATVSVVYLVGLNLLERVAHNRKLAVFPSREVLEPAARFSLFVFLASALIFTHWRLFYQKYVALWEEIAQESWLSAGALEVVLVLAVTFGGFVVAFGRERFLGADDGRVQRNIIAFFVIGFCAYAFVYYLSPGYIFSGYRFRLTPFTVFHTQLLPAIAIYFLVRALLNWWPDVKSAIGQLSRRGQTGSGRWVAFGRSRWVGSWCLALAMLLGLGIYWARMQITYTRLLPPDHFSVFKQLNVPPYAGATFAAGSYAAPVAAYTGQWAYYDPSLVAGITLQGPEGERFLIDHTYLWVADRKTNKDYEKPEYFICLVIQTLPSVLSSLMVKRGELTEYSGCTSQEIVKMAIAGRKDIYPRPELLAIDTEGPQRIGFDSWAILRLHWDGDFKK